MKALQEAKALIGILQTNNTFRYKMFIVQKFFKMKWKKVFHSRTGARK
jgi:hypothetical protein